MGNGLLHASELGPGNEHLFQYVLSGTHQMGETVNESVSECDCVHLIVIYTQQCHES